MAEIRILNRVNLVSYPTPDEPRVVVAITYQSGLLPPRTVYIPEKDQSPEKEKEVIAADLKKAQTVKPEIYTV